MCQFVRVFDDVDGEDLAVPDVQRSCLKCPIRIEWLT